MLKWIKKMFSKKEEFDDITGLPIQMIEKKLTKRSPFEPIMFSDISSTLFTEDVVIVEGGPVFIDLDGNLRRVESVKFETECGLGDGIIRFMADVNRAIRENEIYYVESAYYEPSLNSWNLRGCKKSGNKNEATVVKTAEFCCGGTCQCEQ